MNILVTGGNGQLASCIKRKITMDDDNKGHYGDNVYIFCSHKLYDITSDSDTQEKFLKENNIEIIINCAAYTNVDKAEIDKESSILINYTAVKQLSVICESLGIHLIHISSDYVFNGYSNTPYKVDSSTDPIGVYGRSKDNGEDAIIESGCNYTIIRTSWLYSNFGKNFFNTMKNFIVTRDLVKVVDDQVGSPTCALDLAEFIVTFISEKSYEIGNEIYHFSNEGVCSWYDFAVAIKDILGDKARAKIIPCFSEEFPSPVKRPHYSVLSKRKITNTLNYSIRHWYEALKLCYADKD